MGNKKSTPFISEKDGNTLLCLALFDNPFFIDDIFKSKSVSPTELWYLLKRCEKEMIFRDLKNEGIGCFEWQDITFKERIITEASAAQWKQVLQNERMLKTTVEFLYKQIAINNRRIIEILFRELINIKQFELFPEGDLSFLKIFVDSTKYFVDSNWRSNESLECAYQIAIKYNDIYSLSYLQIQLSLSSIRTGDPQKARKLLEQAKENACSIGDSRLLDECNLLHAVYLSYYLSDLPKAIAIVEELMGDVPKNIPNSIFIYDPMASATVLVLLAFAYSTICRPAQAIDLLKNLMNAGKKRGEEAITYFAESAICVILIKYNKFELAEKRIENIYEFWKGKENQYDQQWQAGVLYSATLIHMGLPEKAILILKESIKIRDKIQFKEFVSDILWSLLEWFEIHGFGKIEGFDLYDETRYILSTQNECLHGIAFLFEAKKLIRLKSATNEIENYFKRSIQHLKSSGATFYLIRTLDEYSKWATSVREDALAAELSKESSQIKSLIPFLGSTEENSNAESLAYKILDLGRLLVYSDKNISWGELAAKISGHLGTERSIIVLEDNPPSILAYRGGSMSWANSVLNELVQGKFTEIKIMKPPFNNEDTDSNGKLLIIPFESKNLKRKGWLALENRQIHSILTDQSLFIYEALSMQLSIVFENFLLWKEHQEIQNNLEKEIKYYRQNYEFNSDNNYILGQSKAILKVLDLVSKAAPTDSTILITGESGVGKELIAHELHRLSKRKDAQFISLNIAALASGLVTSELFGHEKGAFTGASDLMKGRFELADNGTLFLDEIGELSADVQVRLLRVLQEGCFERVGGSKQIKSDFRLIAATNRDLLSMVKAGKFREDLYYRLNVFPIHVPPLRDRKKDIDILALYFMEKYGKKLGREFEGISETDMNRLIQYHWPGNIRELMHIIERAAILSEGPRLTIPEFTLTDNPKKSTFKTEDIDKSLFEMERDYILEILRKTGGKITGSGAAAEKLKVKPTTLLFKIKKFMLRDELESIRHINKMN